MAMHAEIFQLHKSKMEKDTWNSDVKYRAVQFIFTSIKSTSPSGLNRREEGPRERGKWQPTGGFQVRRQYKQNL